MLHRSKASWVLALAAGAVMARPASAGLILQEWRAPHGGTFTSRNVWGPGHKVPGSKDGAVFDLSGAYTVSFKANAKNAKMVVGRDKLNLKLNGHTYQVAGASGGSVLLGVRSKDNARITVSGGVLRSTSGLIATAALSHATATVTENALWSSKSLTVGAKGKGILNITAGGEVAASTLRVGTANKTNGTILLTSAGSQLRVGQRLTLGSDASGTGLLVLRDEAELDVNNLLDVRRGGTISLGNGLLSAHSLRNLGSLKLTGNDARIAGVFANQGGGTVVITGEQATFDGPVEINGRVFKVGGASKAVFNDVVHGAGAITGGGALEFNDVYSPGNSPAQVNIKGDISFGDAGELDLDLGSSSDLVTVTGSAQLGSVHFHLTNPQAMLYERVVLLTASEGISGLDVNRFSTDLPGYAVVDAGSTPTQLAVMVVPVPEPGAMVAAAGLGMLGLMRRRRQVRG